MLPQEYFENKDVKYGAPSQNLENKSIGMLPQEILKIIV